ncbi:MAG TPA: hypothetical protein VIR81_14420 [Myxococcales bacterium]
MRVAPACPGTETSSPSQSQCEVFMIRAAPGWQERQRRVTAWALSNFSSITDA